MTAPIDTMPKLGSSSSSSSSKRASARARAFPAVLSGASSAELEPPDAGGGGEPEDSDRGKAGAERDRGPGRGRKEAVRERQESVADDAAETGGQRPAPGRGKQRSQPGRRDHAAQIEGDLQARPLKPPLGEEAPAPEGGRRQQGRRGKADELHHEVGGDRAGSAEKIVDARVRRVIETGIADRPGQQREGQAGHAGERDQASDFGRPPLRELPHRGGHVVDK